jgi:hypothetical protein
MKIIRNTPEQLILENRPVWLAVGVTLFSLIFFAIGLLTLGDNPGNAVVFMVAGLGMGLIFNMVFVRRSQLILDAPRNLVELRRRSWFGYKSWTWELHYLDHAIVEGSYAKDTNTSRACLVIGGGMDAGTHPITIVSSSGRGAKLAADTINAWLDSAPPPA